MCEACQSARTNPHHGIYHATCPGCMARMIAHGQECWRSNKEGKMTKPYHDLLIKTAGSAWQSLHEQVKVWAERIEEHKQPTGVN